MRIHPEFFPKNDTGSPIGEWGGGGVGQKRLNSQKKGAGARFPNTPVIFLQACHKRSKNWDINRTKPSYEDILKYTLVEFLLIGCGGCKCHAPSSVISNMYLYKTLKKEIILTKNS